MVKERGGGVLKYGCEKTNRHTGAHFLTMLVKT